MAKHIPEGYHTVTPYLVVRDVEAVLDFVARAFDGKEKMRVTGEGGRVTHAEILVGDSWIMAGNPGDDKPVFPATLYVYVPDCDAVYAKALAAGAKSLAAPENKEYGDRNAGVEDACGNHWYVGTHLGGGA